MKYLFKAITTNTGAMHTAIVVQIDANKDSHYYLFNCPDGFQRDALTQKIKFHDIKVVFVSNLDADYFGGFPGFHLSSG